MEEFILRRLDQCLELGSLALSRVSAASAWFTSPWFGAWAALTTFVTLTALPGQFRFSGDEALVFAGIFAAAGTIAGFLMRRRVATAVRHQRGNLAALGIGIAFLTLEGTVVVIMTIAFFIVGPSPEMLEVFGVALFMPPVLCLPLILFAGTLSGLTLWGVAALLERRSRAEMA